MAQGWLISDVGGLALINFCHSDECTPLVSKIYVLEEINMTLHSLYIVSDIDNFTQGNFKF